MTENEKKINLTILLNKVNNSDISSIKPILLHIMRVVKDSSSGAQDLKNIIEIDPPLSARLLKVANSSYYGFQRKIMGITEAIVALGFKTVKELALNQKVYEIYSNSRYVKGYSGRELWKHSVAVALCSKLLYRREFREHGNDIYVAGLLHDIGIIIEDQFMHDTFQKVLGDLNEGTGNLMELEHVHFGFHHGAIGKTIAENWGFPEKLTTAIGYHHEPGSVKDEHKKITRTLYIANSVCMAKNIGFCDAPYTSENLFQHCLAELNVTGKAVNLIAEEVEGEINNMEKVGWF